MTKIKRKVSAKLYYVLFIPEKYTLFAKRPELLTPFTHKIKGKKTKPNRDTCINEGFQMSR